jgi:hypothetical protein
MINSYVDVKVGQVWMDNDSRVSNRFLRVVRIEGEKAVCVLCNQFGEATQKRERSILIRRMRPTRTGYVLHIQAESEVPRG